MANYLTQPAYQTYQTEDYRLPKQQIVQAIATRNAYWDQGASQLKNAYQNYLGLDLSLKANQDKLDGLMQGVNTNLKNVVSTDLSLADNINTAMKIFDPITKDDDIKYDNAVTKHYKSEIQKAQTLKNVNGGKDYNDANFQDMVKPLQDFIKSDDPSKARETYSNRKYYTPYHDVMADWNAAEKNFKPDIKEFTRPETDANGKLTNTGRMITEKNKSIYASQFRAYMSAHLPDKAKEQLAINGRVAYGDDLDVLSRDYQEYNNDKLSSYQTEIEALQGKKNAAVNSGRKSDAEAYQHDIDQYTGEVKRLNITNTKLKIGDYSELQKNKEKVAGQLYTSNWIDNISKSSERKDIEVKYSSDDAGLFFLKMSNDNDNKNKDRQLDWDIAQLSNDTKLATAKGKKKVDENGVEIPLTEPDYSTATEADNINTGKAEIDKMQTDGETIKTNAVDGLNKYLASIGIVDPSKSKATNDAAIEEWHKVHPNDYRWKEYTEQLNLGNAKTASAKAVQTYIDEELKKTNPEFFNREEINKLNSVNFNGTTITSNDIQNALEGKSSKLTIVKNDKTKPVWKIDKGGYNNQIDHYQDAVYLNGNLIGYRDPANKTVAGWIGSNSVIPLLNNVTDINRNVTDKYIEKLNKLYDQALTNIEGLERFIQQPGQKEGESPLLDNVRTVIMNKLGASGLKPTDIFITDLNRNGDIYFKVDKTATNIDNDKLNTAIKGVGIKESALDGGSYKILNSEIGNFIKPRTFSDSRLEPIQIEVDYKRKLLPNNGLLKTTSIKFNNRDFYFRVTNKNGVPFYEVIDEDSEASFINFATGQPFSSLEEAAQTASMLSKLKPEDLQEKIRDPDLGNKKDYQINPKKDHGR